MIESSILSLAIAALAGMAVGIEREWSGHATGPDARFAGVRTFLLLGLLGGAAGLLSTIGYTALGVTLLAGGAALTVAAYAYAARRGPSSIDGTTEAAALAVLALGALAGTGELALASGAAAVIVLVLMEKARFHALVGKIGERELRSALQFAVMSLVILPVLPARAYGPLGGVNPRALWTLVLLFTALNFAGYLARRALGARRGWGVAGMLGGLVSSTSVALLFARRSREEPALSEPLALGIVGSSTVLLARLAVMTAVLNGAVAVALLPYLAPPLIVGAMLVGIAIVRSRGQPREATPDGEETRSPLRLSSALTMALAFQVALWVIAYVNGRWGTKELLVSAAALGLTDMDALTVSMTRTAAIAGQAELAALAIAVGVVSNSALKLLFVLTLGSPALRRFAGLGMAALGAASLFAVWGLNR